MSLAPSLRARAMSPRGLWNRPISASATMTSLPSSALPAADNPRHSASSPEEPFGALDNQPRALMQEMLLGIWERDQKTVLFVTHDIEEAIFLGSRVIVMSARPGSIKAEIVVDLPHPRSYKIKTTPEFVRLKERLRENDLHQR